MGGKPRKEALERVVFEEDRGSWLVDLDGQYAGELEFCEDDVEPDGETTPGAWEFYDRELGEWASLSLGTNLIKAKAAVVKHLLRDRDDDWHPLAKKAYEAYRTSRSQGRLAKKAYEAYRTSRSQGRPWEEQLLFQKRWWVAVAKAVVEGKEY